MLDFIILGIVPGTQFIVTFGWVIAFGCTLTVLSLIWLELRRSTDGLSLRRNYGVTNLQAIDPPNQLA